MIDFIIAGLILLAVILAVRKIAKNQKSGGCGGGCSGCSSAAGCSAYETLEAEAKETLQDKNKDERVNS